MGQDSCLKIVEYYVIFEIWNFKQKKVSGQKVSQGGKCLGAENISMPYLSHNNITLGHMRVLLCRFFSIKFTFSKKATKATKIEKLFTIDLTLRYVVSVHSKCQIDDEDFVNL